MPLRERLDAQSADDLRKMLRIARIKPVTNNKASIIVALNDYLSNQQNIIEIWHSLDSLEKDLMVEYLRSGGGLGEDEIGEIYKKYKRDFKTHFGSYYNRSFTRYLNDLSRTKLFFIGSYIPPLIIKTLETFVPAPEIVFSPVKTLQENSYDAEVIIGESFVKDFVNVIKLVNTAALKATPKSQMPTKMALVKIDGVLENKEIMMYTKNIRDTRNIDHTTRIYGITKLLLESDIIMINDDVYVVGDNASEFLMTDLVKKCSMLLNGYIESWNIDELERIKEIKLQTESSREFTDCRKLVLQYLSKCPINEWIAMRDLQQLIKKYNRKYLVSVTGEISVYDNYQRFYAGRYNDWLKIEGRFIEVVLLEYLVAMGIVDVTVDSRENDYGVEYLAVIYFRLTQLGAYVLGVNDDYAYHITTSENSGFIVQPNYEIVITEGNMSHVHSLFLDPFAEKVSDDVVTIYKLSFKAMVTALDNGIKIGEIIDYLKEHSTHDIPENVLLSLQDWDRVSKRIRIRKVTLLETDDEYLLQELKSYKTINKYITKELTHAFEIDGKAASKLKREIEKKNHFCQIE